MAIKKTIEIDVNASDAEKDVKKLTGQFEDLGKAASKSINNIEKATEDTEKSTKSLADGFKGVGLAIKAMGIGLIIGALSTLKEVFMGNQKVADTFSAVMGTVANVFSQVTNIVVSVIEKVGNATNGFEGLKKTIGGLLTLGLTPLKLAFYGIKLTIDEVRLAWEESLFGDKDPKTIKALTKRIDETKDSLKEVGTDALKAGKQVANNIGKAVGEVGAVIEGSVAGISKISVEGAVAQAKANVQLQNTAKLAEAEQARLVEIYDRQAEKLRKVRDNEFNTIEERQKANNDLLKVLDKQETAMLAQANAQVAAAKSTYQQNKSIENQAAVTNALANAEGVLSQVQGLRSEQDSNLNSLAKEAIELTKTKQTTETELAINEKKFNAERIKDEEQKLLATKAAFLDELTAAKNKLKDDRELYKEGTQARADAESEFLLKKQEIDQQIKTSEDSLAEYRRNKAIENQQLLIDAEASSFETKRNALIEQERLLLEDKALSEEQRNAIEQQYSKARVEIGRLEFEQKMAQANETANVLGNLANLVGKQTAAGKALGIATALINTYVGVSEALKQKSTLPSPYDYVAKAVNVAAILATGFKSVKAITAVKVPGGGGGGGGSAPSMSAAGGGAAGGGGAAPSFNVVGNSGVNQIAQTLGAQQPVQAYVVANNVTTQQALDRNIVRNASIG
jgi:hypothetical protein